jgi:hypothetical protein
MPEAEVWSVAIAPDNIQSMTLDQLDEAFQKGLITENAMVWTDGMDSWQRLREVLGEDEPAPEAAPIAAAPIAAAPAMRSAFPVRHRDRDAGGAFLDRPAFAGVQRAIAIGRRGGDSDFVARRLLWRSRRIGAWWRWRRGFRARREEQHAGGEGSGCAMAAQRVLSHRCRFGARVPRAA